jgi:hypothetical protein
MARNEVIFLGRLARCIGLASTDLLAAFTHKTPQNTLPYTLGLDSYADRGQWSLNSIYLVLALDFLLTLHLDSASLFGHTEQVYSYIPQGE